MDKNIEKIDEEIWKDVLGYEGFYQVSNLGNVKSTQKIGQYQNKEMAIITPVKEGKNGGLTVRLVKNGIKRERSIHKIVAEAFIENPENMRYVHHIDKNNENNNVSNLVWSNKRERIYRGDNNRLVFPKNSPKYNELIKLYQSNDYTIEDLTKKYNCSTTVIYQVLKNENIKLKRKKSKNKAKLAMIKKTVKFFKKNRNIYLDKEDLANMILDILDGKVEKVEYKEIKYPYINITKSKDRNNDDETIINTEE